MDESKANVYDEKLKSCPFCGGEAKIVSRSTEVKDVNLGTTEVFSTSIVEWCKVKCSECGCSTDRYSSVGGAIKWWNKRAADNLELPTDRESACRVAEGEELRKFKEYLCKREDKVKAQEHCMLEISKSLIDSMDTFNESVLPKIDAFKEKLDNFPY